MSLPRFGLCLAAVTAPAVAQFAGGGNPGNGWQPPFTPASQFSWTSGPQDLGTVSIPVGPGGGWLYLPQLGFQFRLVPSWSSVRPSR
ncbi:MAG: hypothetical protein FJ299_05200 [Planctomycetes bacterium]|nr:hypothetical protein [Planctomycetota bacterium]